MAKAPIKDPTKLPEVRLPQRKGDIARRLTPKMKACLEAMGYEGLSLPLAALRAGMNVESARAAMRKPHMKIALNQLIAEVRQNAAQLAYVKMTNLGTSAVSEHVQMEASKWVAGVDNIAPVRRVEGKFSHDHSFKGFDVGQYGDEEPVDVTPHDTTSEGDGG